MFNRPHGTNGNLHGVKLAGSSSRVLDASRLEQDGDHENLIELPVTTRSVDKICPDAPEVVSQYAN